MEFGICNLAIVPLRAEPSERSELASQLLCGEVFEVMELQEKWARIITSFDGYEGWVSTLQFAELNKDAYRAFQQTPATLTHLPVTQAWRRDNDSVLYLPIGSTLGFLEGTACHIQHVYYDILGEIGARASLETSARSFLNVPYLWGGRTHFGIDCSGFTQAVLRLQGVNLKRDAYLQAEQGQTVDFLQEAQLGDLAFFDNAEGRITHVGILLSNDKIIHASGKVKIDKIDTNGIYSHELQRYTHKLRIIKRI